MQMRDGPSPSQASCNGRGALRTQPCHHFSDSEVEHANALLIGVAQIPALAHLLNLSAQAQIISRRTMPLRNKRMAADKRMIESKQGSGVGRWGKEID